MKKLFCLSVVAMVMPLLSGCNNGSPADPPSALSATAGDGRVKLTWTGSPGVEYMLFSSTDSSSTISNWANLPNAHSYSLAVTPFYMCGLYSGTPYYIFANGRTNGGPGGPTTPTVSATPYNASAHWIANVTPLSQNLVNPNLYGVGYASLTTCSNNTTSAAGSFAAVGAGGAIFTSNDGQNWNTPSSLPPGFTSDLYAVTGYVVNLNNPTTPGLRWVAVGAGGASVYSTDGITWSVGRANLGNPALRSLTQVTGNFTAVGDTGTILSSIDGITWTAHTSGSTQNLRGITHGSIYIAVGDGGTVLTSADGNVWGTQASGTTSILRQVATLGSIIVAVGDSGTIVTSINGGVTWTTQSLPNAPSLVAVAAESQLVINGVIDTLLGVIPSAQFVAVDSAGNTYTSVNGVTWLNAMSTGISSPNALVSSGFGYVATGNSGATAYAF